MATRKPTARLRGANGVSNVASSSRLRYDNNSKAKHEPKAPVDDLSEVPGKKSNEGESNIQVVIRCRRRNDRELQEASPIIISTEGPRGQNITIETAAPSSILAVVTLPPTRTYPFDVVFGPEADQAMVYQDVVHPMLEEVLQGYNCTLFAYGQTGTGKTYTMQGDLGLTPLGNPTAQAGMIPRTLFKLFSQLDSSGCDYSVKVSYVELYNEELRDLLAPELSAPSGATQPMGMGNSKDAQGGLRIFDDQSKRGVFIQGLEETPVKDFTHALALLSKGSQRRQIAATKFNDHSSRSHSVFSVTVHSKETSTLGDDLLKVGKLNLVDLAGSENIGRSGAENKRAREAGMINQSLLTLGRVINALVDKSSHVPYRESKLTRLLQDSLGGRTKTCIIATVSPARSNMEETLSTLDYAMRAKSIRNKPEVNQRMSRNALLKEYIGEIERLKSDVLAAREKNGIYFSEDTWAQMNSEHEMRQTEVEESKKQVEMIESQMRLVREEFEQSISLLMKTDKELKTTKERLRSREGELKEKEGELKEVKNAFEEEVIVRKAHAASEDVLDDIAIGLKKVVHESTSDVDGLFGKIERKMTEFESKTKAIKGQTTIVESETRSFLSSLQMFVKASEQSIAKMKLLTETYQKKESSSLSSQHQAIDEQMKKITAALKTLQSKEDASEQNLTNIWTIVKEVQDRLANELSIWSGSTQNDIKTMCADIEGSTSARFAAAEQAIASLCSIIDKLVKEGRSAAEGEKKAAEKQNEMILQAAQSEITRLKEQNAHLSGLLESERKNALKARDGLLKRVSSMLEEFIDDRDKDLRDTISGLQESNTQASETMESLTKKHDLHMSEIGTRNRVWSSSLEKLASEGGQAKLAASEELQNASSSVQEGLFEIRSTTTSAIETHSEGIMQVSKTLNSCSKVFEREHKIKRARTDTSTHLAEDACTALQGCQGALDTALKNINSFGKQQTIEANALQAQLSTHQSASNSHMTNIQRCNHDILEQGTSQAPPTGTTPQKRKWHYVDKWDRTRNRHELLRELHRQRGTPAGNTYHSPSLPLVPTTESRALNEHVLDDFDEDMEDNEEDSLLGAQEEDIERSPQARTPETDNMGEDQKSDPLRQSVASSSVTLSEDPVEPIPPPTSHPTSRSGRRESGIPVKALPARVTLQEKPTNIVNENKPARRTLRRPSRLQR